MTESSASPVSLILPHEGEAWSAIEREIEKSEGETLVVIVGREEELIADAAARKRFLAVCKKAGTRVHIATKHPTLLSEARAAGVPTVDRTKRVKEMLADHPRMNDAVRAFSPHLWHRQLKSSLQHMGLLSVPKMRTYSLAGLSVALFYIVVFRLLPSADIIVKPKQESTGQTVNIFLVQSGVTLNASDRVRRMPLVPVVAHIQKSVTFDHISKEFIGTSSRVELTIVNKSGDTYALKANTRFSNQAGMVFRITSHAIVEPGEETTVAAKAEDLDLYGQIIGDRGNVPAGLKWEIPGLSPEERKLVYGENREAGKGGVTAYRTVLRAEDLEVARKRLELELLAEAKESVAEQVREANERRGSEHMVLLNYAELSRTTYENFVLPEQFLGQTVTSVPVQGGVTYVMYSYDADAILHMLLAELRSHVREGRRLIEESAGREQLVAHVIDYADDLSWIKLTVDLTGTEEYILDPLSAAGALFGKNVREQTAGKKRDEALRIIRNMPEVERVEIRQWPPWNRTMPGIGSHISIMTE